LENLCNLCIYRSINLYVARACLLKSSCEVLVAKSDFKSINRCEDSNVDPKLAKDEDFISLPYGGSQGQIIGPQDIKY
jgi:hypothetical protein